MVEQSRRPSRVVSLQAGPVEADAVTQLDANLRMRERAARAFGRQLAAIGDQLDHEVTSRRMNRLPAPLQLLQPAQALTLTVYRDVHGQLGGVQGLSAAVKTWITNTTSGQGVLRVYTLTTWVTGSTPETCAGWTGGLLVTAALVATVSVFCTLWAEPEEP